MLFNACILESESFTINVIILYLFKHDVWDINNFKLQNFFSC